MKTYTLSLLCLLTQFAITHGQHHSASSAVKIDPHQRRYAKQVKEPTPAPVEDESEEEEDEDGSNGGGGNTDESPDVKSLMYYNADKITQNVQDGLHIEQTRDSTPPGTYTNVKEDGTVELKCIDNGSIQGDGIHIWVAHGSGNSNNHITVEYVKSSGDGVYIYLAQGAENQNNTITVREIEAIDPPDGGEGEGEEVRF